MTVARFELFGPDHLTALVLSAAAVILLVVLVRRFGDRAPGTVIRFGLAGVLLLGVVTYLVAAGRSGTLSAWDLLPLHLCDFAIFVGVFALLTRRQLACELLYFWGCTGATLAMVTPDVWYGFPDWRFLIFFAMHAAVLAAALTLVLGFRITPRPGAAWRVLLLTLGYAAVVGLVDWVFDKNFLFLRGKPQTRTLLDSLGPWPNYLLACALLALVLFLLLELPFRLRRAGSLRPAGGIR